MKESEKHFAIVVAGGAGTRMSSTIPKQFLLLAGKPLLVHTTEAFFNAIDDIQIVLVLPSNHLRQGQEIVSQYFPTSRISIVIGGDTRFASVYNGLESIIALDGYIAVHDAVRPLVDVTIIKESFKQAKLYGNAIATVDLKDSLREIFALQNKAQNRANYKLVQTPQTFQLNTLKHAYKNGLNKDMSLFTDDASVIEAYGEKINLFNGSYENIKITTPEDLIIAEAIISNRLTNQY